MTINIRTEKRYSI